MNNSSQANTYEVQARVRSADGKLGMITHAPRPPAKWVVTLEDGSTRSVTKSKLKKYYTLISGDK